MISRRLQIFSISLLAALSVFLSPVAACVCAHHTEQEAEVSHHSHVSETAEHPENAGTAELAPGDECVCVAPAVKLRAKSESVKVKKQAPAAAVLPGVSEIVLHANVVHEGSATASLLLPEPYYIFRSTRGPPDS
jgi:hypothetical protein